MGNTQNAPGMEELDKRWKATAKILLGCDAMPIARYEKWLSEFNEPVSWKKSAAGEQVAIVHDYYCKGAAFASLEQAMGAGKAASLDINAIKDIDSIAKAIGEIAVYSGSVVLGNSSHVSKSTDIYDSSFVHASTSIANSEYIAHTSNSRFGKNIFGCDQVAQSEFVIRGVLDRMAVRCFETWQCDSISDCYYSSFLQACQECMFCFNLKGTSCAIGNLVLGREKYIKAKKSLLEQLASELEAKKRLPSLMSMFEDGEKVRAAKPLVAGKTYLLSGKPGNPQAVEDEFSSTTGILIGKRLSNLDSYSKWLVQHAKSVGLGKGAISGEEMVMPLYSGFAKFPKNRLISLAEAQDAGKMRLEEKDALGLNLGNAGKLLGKIAYFCAGRLFGANMNLVDCPVSIDSANCYRIPNCVFTKNSAYSYWPRNSDHCFGCSVVFESSFALRCYNSSKLTRCFEVEASRDCSDCYFCHNCENVRNSMFCFNAKNLNYAIGNTVVGRESFLKIKKQLLAEIAGKLEKEKCLELSIYNVGCAAKR